MNLAAASVLAAPAAADAAKAGSTPSVSQTFGLLPMSFEPNAGQTDPRVRFLSRGRGYTLFLTDTEAVLSLRGAGAGTAAARTGTSRDAARVGQRGRPHPAPALRAELRLSLAGANPHPHIEGLEESPGTVNYFLGNKPEEWRVGLHPFARVEYHQVYPGVDLVYYGNQRQLEYDFIVSPGADAGRIFLGFGGAEGLEVDAQGGLVVHLAGGGVVRWNQPFVYQEAGGTRQGVRARFQLKGAHQAGFDIGAYDPGRPLIIDPALVYATYLGGSDYDTAEAIAVDTSGNVYVAGNTASVDFPTTNAFRATPPSSNAVYVAKLNASGTALVYATYLGGSVAELMNGIAVDTNGNAYVTGNTESANFPTKNSYQSALNGTDDAFITKLGPRGTNLLYSTYFGGPDYEAGNCIAVDNSGNAYVGGETFSGRNFPTLNPFQSKAGGFPNVSFDAFVAKFNTTLSGPASLVYSSWLGGSTDERATGIAVDAAGNVYVTGDITDSTVVYPAVPSSDFPTLNPFQPTFNNGSTDPLAGLTDGFVTKINAAGSAMVFSTFLGGSAEDSGLAIAVDAGGRVYVTGQTSSTDFPTLNAAQPVIGGTNLSTLDAFVTVFQASGTNLLYSTYLGGDLDEAGNGIAVDQFGTVYVAGQTSSDNFPTTVGCDQPAYAGGFDDVFVTKINPTVPGPASLVYSTYLGGNDDDFANAMALDANGNFYVTGISASTNFPTTAGVLSVTNHGGFGDGFVAKFSSPADLSVAALSSADLLLVGSNLTYTLYINNNGRSSFSNVTLSNLLAASLQFLSVTSTVGSCSQSGNVVTCSLGQLTNGASAIVTIATTTTTPGTLTNIAVLTGIGSEINTGNNTSVVSTVVRGIADVRLSQVDAPDPVFVTSNLTYTIGITNKGPWPATSLVLTDALPAAVSYVSANAARGTWSTNDAGFTYSLDTLNSGDGVAVTILTTALTPGTASNPAGVGAFELDSNPSNNVSTITTTINPLADLSLGQTVSAATVFATSNLTYTLAVTNHGPSTATGVVVTNPLPAGAGFVSAQTSQGTTSLNNGVFTANLGSLATGATATVILVLAAPALAGPFTNTATVGAGVADPNPSDNSASRVTTVTPLADIAVSQSAAPNPVFVSSNLTYTILVTNKGPSTATATVLTDPLAAGLVFVSVQSTVGTCSFANGVVTGNLGDLANHAAATVTLTVRPMLDGTVVNTASAASAVTDPNTNNTSSIAVTVNNLPNAPVLKILRSGTNVVLYWSTNVVGFGLQASTNLVTAGAWAAVTNVPVVVGDQFMVTNGMNLPTLNYRLSKSLAQPSLTATPAGTNIVISWPTTASGFTLQSTGVLSATPTWKVVTNNPVTVGNRYYVTNGLSGSSSFYRLVQ